MIVYSFLAPGLYGGVVWEFYHWNYGRILGWADGEWEDFDPVYVQIFLRSARLALTNVLITLVICYPAALWVSRLSVRWQTLVVFPDHPPLFRQPSRSPVRLGVDPSPFRFHEYRVDRPRSDQRADRHHLLRNRCSDRSRLRPPSVHVPADLCERRKARSLALEASADLGAGPLEDLLTASPCRSPFPASPRARSWSSSRASAISSSPIFSAARKS